MDTLPLPPSPSLEQYRKRAKALVTAAQSTDPAAVREWARAWLESLIRSGGDEPLPFVRGSMERAVAHIEKRVAARRDGKSKHISLADAQYLIAEAHGFENWGGFAQHVEEAEGKRTRT